MMPAQLKLHNTVVLMWNHTKELCRRQQGCEHINNKVGFNATWLCFMTQLFHTTGCGEKGDINKLLLKIKLDKNSENPYK